MHLDLRGHHGGSLCHQRLAIGKVHSDSKAVLGGFEKPTKDGMRDSVKNRRINEGLGVHVARTSMCPRITVMTHEGPNMDRA